MYHNKQITMKREIYIYGLYTEGEDIRYIGKTNKQDITKRLRQHELKSKELKTHRDRWIQKSLKEGKEIKIKKIESVNDENWQDREKYWIKYYRDNGALTNHSDGGKGGCAIRYTKTYEEVKDWVQKNIPCKSKNIWYSETKNLPNFIPMNPREVYLNRGWISWSDFLGTGNKYDNNVNYLNYNDAKTYIKTNLSDIDTIADWKMFVKENQIPDSIPNRPDRYYKNKNRGWDSWGDFLSTGRIANQNKIFLKYDECKEYVRKLNIKSLSEWNRFCKSGLKPDNIPSCLDINYKNSGWVSFGEFFGTGKVSDNQKHKNYFSYKNAKKYIIDNSIKINNNVEWRYFVKNNSKLIFLPLHPEQTYKKTKEWISWYDFLGKNKGE